MLQSPSGLESADPRNVTRVLRDCRALRARNDAGSFELAMTLVLSGTLLVLHENMVGVERETGEFLNMAGRPANRNGLWGTGVGQTE